MSIIYDKVGHGEKGTISRLVIKTQLMTNVVQHRTSKFATFF